MENKTIYVVNHYGNWDGDFREMAAFSTYEKAKAEYDARIEDAREDLLEWYDESEIVIDEDATSCTFYIEGEYNDHHEIIELMTLILK